MTYFSLLPASLLALGIMAPIGAEAQSAACKSRDALTGELTARYGEQMQGAGLRSEDAMIELWRSPDTGSWTMLMSRADGTSCIIAHGTDWVGLPVGKVELKS